MKFYMVLVLVGMVQVSSSVRDSLVRDVEGGYRREKIEFERRYGKARYECRVMSMSMFPGFCMDSVKIGRIKHGVGEYRDGEGRKHVQIMVMSYVRWMEGVEPDRKSYVVRGYVLEDGEWRRDRDIRVDLVMIDRKRVWYGCE